MSSYANTSPDLAWPTLPSRATRLRSRSRRRLLWTLAAAALVVAWGFFLRPQILGGATGYVIVSGSSMEPGLHEGDLVVVRRLPSYAAGDVVAFRVPDGEIGAGAVVIHRIVDASDPLGYVVRGDNRSTPDLWTPAAGRIIGAKVLHLPGGGRVVSFLRSPVGSASIAALVAFVLVLRGEPGSVARGRGRRSHDASDRRISSRGAGRPK